MAPETADIADARQLLGQRLQVSPHALTDPGRPRAQISSDSITSSTACAAAMLDGIAAVGAAQSARMRRVHDGRTAGDRRQREAAAQALGHGDEIGHHAGMLDGEHLAGARDAALDLIGDQHDAVFVAQAPQRAQELEGRDVEAALALHRFDDDGRHRLRIDVAVEQAVEVGQAPARW